MSAQDNFNYEDKPDSLDGYVFAHQRPTSQEPLTPWVYSREKPGRERSWRNLPQKIRSYFS